MLIIEYPNYPEEVQVSKKRKVKYFKATDTLPKKYSPNEHSLTTGLIWKRKGAADLLYNQATQEFVIKNPVASTRPRFVTISGNTFMRMHEHDWRRIVLHLNDFFITNFPSELRGRAFTSFPAKVHMELHTFPKYGGWDTDNMWIYTKCFLDAMKTIGLFPDDNISYVSGSGGVEFFPITKETDKKMVFIISADTQRVRMSHIFYKRRGYGNMTIPIPLERATCNSFVLNVITEYGTPGDLIVNVEAPIPHMIINVRSTKKVIGSEIALGRVFHQCMQLDRVPCVTQEVFELLKEPLTRLFLAEGVPVYIS